ncbi:radical SAM protein, partial [Pseudomonadota bacterium]
MRIKEINAKNILTKSKLTGCDYVINPYVGCQHGCLYCYASFMKRFTNHEEDWGDFIDVKINSYQLLKGNLSGKTVFISSVTDSWQPIEKKYKLMRKILPRLFLLNPRLSVLTKSDLIVRDIDLLRKFKHHEVGISLSTLDENLRKQVEPLASSVEKRINALKELKKAGLKTFTFISPILPG